MKSVIDLNGEDKTNQIYFGGGKVAVGEEKQTEKIKLRKLDTEKRNERKNSPTFRLGYE